MGATSVVGGRLRVGLLTGAGLALGWAALSVFLGSSPAHAADSPGLLGGLGDTVTGATSAVVTTVSDLVLPAAAPADPAATPASDPVQSVVAAVTSPLPDLAATVSDAVQTSVTAAVDHVDAIPVVGPPVATATSHTVNGMTGTVGDAVAPVTAILGSAPAAAITTPVSQTISGIPVVGDLLGRLGIEPLLGHVSGTVDGALGSVGAVLTGAVPPGTGIIPGPGSPGIPGIPGIPLFPAPGGNSAAAADLLPPAVIPGNPAAARSPWSVPVGSVVNSARASAAPSSHPADAPPANPSRGPDTTAVPPGSAGGSSSSAGQGDGSSSPAAVSIDDAAGDTRGTAHTSGTDDALPSSPVYDTDVAPD